jgi:peptidoglycan/LPS O-acetylase OafA/YrhL
MWFVNHDTVSLATLCLIINFNSDKEPLIKLENRLFNFLGRISYSIYTIHTLIIYGVKNLLTVLHMRGAWGSAFLFFGVFILTISIAWLLYEFFEKRFLLLKDKFAVIKNTA